MHEGLVRKGSGKRNGVRGHQLQRFGGHGFPQLRAHLFYFPQGLSAGRRQGEVAFPAATPFGRSPAHHRSQKAFGFQPLQGGVHRVKADCPARALFDFLRDGHAVGPFVEDGYGQQDHFFKFA
jgi:hypothetical protein